MKSQRTRSQETILQLLKQQSVEISAQQVYVALRQSARPLGLATVYRSLEALKLSGAIQARTLSSGETLYSQVREDRHHLTCLQCGASVPIEDADCPVQALEEQLQTSAKFEIYYHTLEFFGLCNPCQVEQIKGI
ncbi:MAG: Fur family transcriptional regulator [Cyanobacteria bacterium P01_F01_bin.42]